MTRHSFLAGLATLVLLAACDERSAGGSTDTETGALQGVALLLENKPAARAIVEVSPADSALVSRGPVAARFATVSDDQGRWRIEGVPPGRWTLLFTNPEGKRALLSAREVSARKTDSSEAILHTVATLRLQASGTRRAWIEGTDLSTDLVDGSGVLGNVPAGYAFRLRAGGYVSDSLTLRPSQDTTILLP
jgi:hypothetical protein